MKIKLKATLFLIAVLGALLSIAGSAQQADDPGVLLRAAIEKEEVDGDLQGAIDLYKKIIAKYGRNRAIAAQAQLHLGYCFEKLGLKEAQKAYQNVIDKYPEQAEAVKVAKERLFIILKAQAVIDKGDEKFRVRKVWDNSVDSFFFGSPSPDGRYVSYVDWMNFGNLGVRDLLKGENHLLTNNDSWDKGEMAYGSVFSRDGSKIAYCWQNKEGIGELRVIKRDGSQPRVLYGDEKRGWPRPAAWSSDGKHILTFLHTMGKSNTIAFISITDGSVRVVKTLGPCTPQSRIGMSLSPDERYIVYNYIQQEDSKKHDIFLLTADGSRHSLLIEHPADDKVIGWTPDGKGVLFSSDRAGSSGIWLVQVADGRAEGAPQLLRAEMGNFKQLGMTQDGSFFYGLNSGWSDIYTATIDPKSWEIKSQPVKIIKQFEGFNSAPDCSSDGKYLVCRSSRGGEVGSAALLFRSFSTGEIREVVPKRGISLNFHYLRWSPDGQSILGVGSYKEKYGYLFAIDSQTGDVEIIAQPDKKKGTIHRPDWSPDGKAVFFYRMSKAYSITRRDLKTGAEKEIYSPPKGNVYALILSPDGQHLAFSSDNKLMVLSVAGGEPKELTPVKNISTIAWTRDSKYILYGLKRDKGDKVDLWRIMARGGEPQKLELAMTRLIHLRTHPDGQRIVFTAQSRPPKAEIWVMENFLSEVEIEK